MNYKERFSYVAIGVCRSFVMFSAQSKPAIGFIHSFVRATGGKLRHFIQNNAFSKLRKQMLRDKITRNYNCCENKWERPIVKRCLAIVLIRGKKL